MKSKIISFKPAVSTVDSIDKIAEQHKRTRANMIDLIISEIVKPGNAAILDALILRAVARKEQS
jgi:hypothetical protein